VRLGYVCQYFTTQYRGPATNLMYELSKEIDVVNYSSVEKHMQYYSGGVHDDRSERLNERLLLRRYDVSFKLSGLLYPSNLYGMLVADKPDIVQSEEYYQPATRQAFKYANEEGIPFIFNHRGSDDRTRSLRERLFFRYANPSSRRLVEESDAIICLSEAGKKVLCGIFPKAESKVTIIPNSIDPLMYAGADGFSFRREHNIPDTNPLLLCVARLHPQKRIDLLVEAFAEVKRQVPDAVLCVVGPWFPSEKRKIDSRIAALKLNDVVFTGPIPNEKVKDAYDAADVVALTSEYEPFGYCLLEAMSLSKPTVAFGIGAVPEIIENGVTGYHVPFPDVKALADKTAHIFKHRTLAKRMGSQALKRVEDRFHIRDNSTKLTRLLRQLKE